MRIDGLLVPNVTPFDGKGALDLGALERVVDHLVAGGVDGLVPCGTTGEYYALSADERAEVLRVVHTRARGKVKLIAGTNAGSTREVIAHSKTARKIGYEAILLAPPFYSLPQPGELVAHFKAVAKAVDLPIVLYNFPARAGVELDWEVLDGLADCKAVVGIKESSGVIARLYGLMLRYGERYQICCGADDQAFDYFAWGVRSWIAGAANVAPKQHAKLMRTALAGKLPKARDLMWQLMPVLADMEAGKFNQKAKYGLELSGIPAGPVRAPLQALTRAERDAFRKRWKKVTG